MSTATVMQHAFLAGIADYRAIWTWRSWVLGWMVRVIAQVSFFGLIGLRVSNDRAAFYLGSADLMPRNLDHRVEVVTPIEDVAIQAELVSTFEALWRDTATSFELDASGGWERVLPKKDERPRSGQQVLMRRARRRLSLARSR